MSIIGYSLRSEDKYIRQILYSFVRNDQIQDWGEESCGLIKTPTSLVNLAEDENAQLYFQEQFRFVDWKKVEIFGDGFNVKSLDKIFI